MNSINIRTTLGICPKHRPHEILVITRGATACIDYDLFNKVYTMDYIEQITFIFQQGKKKWSYDMIEYFKPASGVALTDTLYYERLDVNVPAASKYRFVVKEIPVGQSVSGYYEKCKLENGQDLNDNWQFDEHFTYYVGNNYAYVNFTFNQAETIQFAVTEPGNNVMFEVVTRFDTDNFEGMHSRDSVVIDRQHDIAVVGSLYAGNSYSDSTSDADLVCSNDLICR